MDEKVTRALELFGLTPPFEEEDLRRASRRVLKEVHPDTSREKSGVSVDHVLDARHLLEKYLIEQGPASGRDGARNREEMAYRSYREGMRVFNDALEDYWKARLRYSHSSESAPYLHTFRSKLILAKKKFVAVLDTDPGGLWTADAVEEIARINVWLGL